jgi:hypothetical protein
VTSKAEEYRAKAAECEQRARQAHDAAAKRDFEELARHWRQLADLIARKAE